MKRVLIGVILGLLGALVVNELVRRVRRPTGGAESAPAATSGTHA